MYCVSVFAASAANAIASGVNAQDDVLTEFEARYIDPNSGLTVIGKAVSDGCAACEDACPCNESRTVGTSEG